MTDKTKNNLKGVLVLALYILASTMDYHDQTHVASVEQVQE